MKRIILFTPTALLILFFGAMFAQEPVCAQKDFKILQAQLNRLADFNLPQKNISEVAVIVGESFLKTPYEAHTIEVEGDERLVIYLSGLDCTTFLENVVVLSRICKKDACEYEDFLSELEYLRYRDGILNGYPSRLHYFSDWIDNNEKKGILANITQEIGGEPYQKVINFMSTHTSSYKQLSESSFVESIQIAEAELNQRDHYYIPKEKLQSIESSIKSGDLIAITTSIKGLDISHTGMAYQKNGRLHFLHASTSSDQVEITDIPLADYLKANKRQSGIMVARLVFD